MLLLSSREFSHTERTFFLQGRMNLYVIFITFFCPVFSLQVLICVAEVLRSDVSSLSCNLAVQKKNSFVAFHLLFYLAVTGLS